jgi:hypothetical protein
VHELGQQRGGAGEQEGDQFGNGDADVGTQRGQDREQGAGALLLLGRRVLLLGRRFLLLGRRAGLTVRPVSGGGRVGARARLILCSDGGFLPE